MPDISKVKILNLIYTLKDAVARSNLGDLTTLTSKNKDSLVAAFNELRSNVGDITSLTSENKSSVVAALNEALQNIEALQGGSGGSGSVDDRLFIVTTTGSINAATSSHSAAEILAAINAGKLVILNFFSSLMFLFDHDTAQVTFTVFAETDSNKLVSSYVTIDNNKKAVPTQHFFPVVPEPTADDYGKVLSASAAGLRWVEMSGGSTADYPNFMEVGF